MDGLVAALPGGIAICQYNGVRATEHKRTATMEKDTMIGVDLAKSVFQVHGVSMMGQEKFRRKLLRHIFSGS